MRGSGGIGILLVVALLLCASVGVYWYSHPEAQLPTAAPTQFAPLVPASPIAHPAPAFEVPLWGLYLAATVLGIVALLMLCGTSSSHCPIRRHRRPAEVHHRPTKIV